jgi:hypothetical protein
LIERYESRATLETASWPPGVRAPAGGHRCHDDGPQVLVQFVRGHDDARPRLLDFAAQSRIESNKEDVAATDRRAR